MVVGIPELTGAGAMQVVFDGRSANPEMLLESDDDVDDKEDDTLTALAEDCTTMDDEVDLLLPPPPLPPQEARKIKQVINRIFLTQVFMAIISWCNTIKEKPTAPLKYKLPIIDYLNTNPLNK